MAKPTRTKKEEAPPAADHSEELLRLRRVRGQIEGVERMIEQRRYCVDIVHQIRSIMAALKSTETLMLERHLRGCVRDAIEAQDERKAEEKIEELLEIFNKR